MPCSTTAGSGEYWFGETPVHSLNRKQRADLARQRIGMVFQSYHLLDDLTVAENIDLPLSYKNLPAKERQGMVADILDRFQIVAKKDLFPSQLSGGQQQLVGIARAVVHAPALLLADEPTGNLHSTQAREIMELFRQLNHAGTTIVQVTHSEENARYGKRIVELRDGWLTRDEVLPEDQCLQNPTEVEAPSEPFSICSLHTSSPFRARIQARGRNSAAAGQPGAGRRAVRRCSTGCQFQQAPSRRRSRRRDAVAAIASDSIPFDQLQHRFAESHSTLIAARPCRRPASKTPRVSIRWFATASSTSPCRMPSTWRLRTISTW